MIEGMQIINVSDCWNELLAWGHFAVGVFKATVPSLIVIALELVQKVLLTVYGRCPANVKIVTGLSACTRRKF